MTIGIDASRLESQQKTGVEWYVYFLLLQMKQSVDTRTKVILYSRVPIIRQLGDLPKNWENRVLGWPPKRLWTQLRLSWEMFRRPVDVLFVPAHVFPIVHPKKTVMMVHDIAAYRQPQVYSWFERWYSLWSAKFAALHLWKVIVPSEFTKEELLDYLTNKKHYTTQQIEPIAQKIQVVHHGYDKGYEQRSDPKKVSKILNKYGIQKSYILSVGRLELKKNTVQIIQSFEKLKERLPEVDLQLVLVGKPGYGYEKIELALRESPYRDDIILPGWIPQEHMRALYALAEVFLYPSVYEGFGMPLLESFASKTPVIASDLQVLEEVGGQAGVYVDFSDVESIARSLEAILKIDTLREEKIQLGQERLQQFSWKKCAQETLQSLLG
ncbi:glycosyltransferase family 4 protein [Candidatus Nomurabacteria bacterium]|nr:glycosyltransferase family 4 protein [Candidatus Nomurabacteria bacterium]